MERVRTKTRRQKLALSSYSFTVFFAPVREPGYIGWVRRGKRVIRRAKNPLRISGYQVTVPILPGLITYGRTLDEARTMAADAIRCHLEGMLKAGEEIPGESKTYTEKLRVAVPA
jgi:predicted RNase H-like HicB family nuclease